MVGLCRNALQVGMDFSDIELETLTLTFTGYEKDNFMANPVCTEKIPSTG